MKVTTRHADGTTTFQIVPDIDMDAINRRIEAERLERIANIKPASHYAAMEDRDLVVACLHASGGCEHLVNDAIQWEAYCLADGFGWLEAGELSAINDGWDWSHVRDSTPEGIARIAYFLRRKLRAIFSL